jgi:hypothetical protein
MIRKFIEWYFSSTEKPSVEHTDLYTKFLELEEKYKGLLLDVKRLEEENIETSNCLYELGNSIDAVDARIDILTAEKWVDKISEQN